MADCLRTLCPCLRWRQRQHYESVAAYPSATYAQQQQPRPPAPLGGGAAIGSTGSSSTTVSPALPGSVGLPSWVADDSVSKCYGCAAPFDVLHRRHHCRRCRNVVCGGCSANERPVLLAGIREPVRVCMRCSSEVARENHFLDTYLTPLLEGGEMTLTRGLIMARRVPVRLLLAPSLDRLEIRDAAAAAVVAPTDPSSPPIVQIPLTSLSGVSEEGALGLLILTDGGKQHRLECAGPSQRGLFTGAIREGAKLVPLMVAFKGRVEQEREQRTMQEQLALSEKLRREEALARRQEKQGFRDQIAQKYGLAAKR